MRIGKKTIHSVIIGLAMALPILYLGGSMIAGLAGAHGQSVFSADYQLPVESYKVDFNQLYEESSSFNNGVSFSPSPYDGDNGFRTWYYPNPAVSGHVYNIRLVIDSHSSNIAYFNFILGNLLVTTQNSGSFIGSSQGVYTGGEYYFVRAYTTSLDNASFKGYFQIFDLTQMFGVGSEPSKDDFNALVDFSYKPYVLSEDTYLYKYENASYTEIIFNQFFPKNNFVERIGQNALSDNPKGFAPFGTMLNYLDSNVFHAGDSQTALMVYGMVYWSLHVVMADLVYHVLVFVPNLINKVFDWFGQRGLNDD